MAAVRPLEADLHQLRARMREGTLRDEAAAVRELIASLEDVQSRLVRAQAQAAQWVTVARDRKPARSFLETMLEQAPLTSVRGRALMSLAEALLRTPDAARAAQLIAEQLGTIRRAEAQSEAPLLSRTAFSLLSSAGSLLPRVSDQLQGNFSAKSLTVPLVAPITRGALHLAMRAMAEVFIAGETIEEAMEQSRAGKALALCSYDMLGEGARTDADAQRYFTAYAHAIEALKDQPGASLHERSGISVKLSALEPRYSLLQRARVVEKLVPQLRVLARAAAQANIGFTIDAEEADRLDLSLDIIEALASDTETRDWPGLGLAVQAYGRRAPFVVDWIAQLARITGRRMTLRLVKGAYWDSEIKYAQERGLKSFPVFTAKAATDVSYLTCARRLFAAADVIYPQFATHNALTVASVLELAPQGAQLEFQRLHGMGEVLYAVAREQVPQFPPVRVYAPVGTHEALLPYLVRRLLENGANSSFVHHFLNPTVSVKDVVSDPINALKTAASPRIHEPGALYGPDRANSRGANFGDPLELQALQASLRDARSHTMRGGPVIDGKPVQGAEVPVTSPSNTNDVVGFTRDATSVEILHALDSAAQAQSAWDATPAEERAACLERAADLLEQRREKFLNLLVREAGKTLPDAIAEVRETVDYCRYYAARGRELFGSPQEMRGPTGEKNLLSLHGRGVFVCISPWNFPLAIFAGQITAALMAGNSVVAKPALTTPLIAHAMVRLLHEAGIPGKVLHLTPLAGGSKFSEIAFRHPAIAGVVLTGSTATATAINRTLAGRDGPLVTLIAETGGLNAMAVDATALPEQVVDDVIGSAFTSAGQRCSALRVLYLQEDIADRVIEMLTGAMKLLRIGDPAELSTDVGPVISKAALEGLRRHAARMRQEAKLLYACDLPTGLAAQGHFFPPHLFELKSLDQLKTEEFGPILHVARYKARELPQVIEAIRGTGFGLTLGVHSRVEGVAEHVFRNLRVGNTYVNRNMIGAVVGVQPFGGCGLSGTGPKAGGPHYLLRFATERTLTINTAAIGGNVELLS